MTHPYETWDAAYVLGALSPQERREFEAHLEGCPRCVAAVGELAGMPALLGKVDVADVQNAPVLPAVPDTLVPRLALQARRRRVRRRAWTVGTGLVAAAAVAAALVLGISRPQRTEPRATTRMASLVSAPVTAFVSLTHEPWGTHIDLRCTYDDGAGPAPAPGGPARWYYLVVVARTGEDQTLSSWQVPPGVTAEPSADTALAVADIRYVEIRGRDGAVLLRSPG